MKLARKLIMAKIEAVSGTAVVPAAATDALGVINFEALRTVVQQDTVAYASDHYGAGDRFTISAHRGIGFQLPMIGAGTPLGTAFPAPYKALVQACGHAVTETPATSVVFSPVSNAEQSATVYVNIDGYLRKLVQARGNLKWLLDEGKIALLTVENMIGLYSAATDTALVVPAMPSFQKPAGFNKSNTTVQIGGTAMKCKRVEFNAGRSNEYRNLAGVEEIMAVDAAPTASFTIEAPAVATKDVWADLMAASSQALQVVHGTVAGNIVTLAATRAIPSGIEESEDRGVLFYTYTFDLKPTTGNDAYTATMT